MLLPGLPVPVVGGGELGVPGVPGQLPQRLLHPRQRLMQRTEHLVSILRALDVASRIREATGGLPVSLVQRSTT